MLLKDFIALGDYSIIYTVVQEEEGTGLFKYLFHGDLTDWEIEKYEQNVYGGCKVKSFSSEEVTGHLFVTVE